MLDISGGDVFINSTHHKNSLLSLFGIQGNISRYSSVFQISVPYSVGHWSSPSTIHHDKILVLNSRT
jgi:hypothetical protein